MIPFKFFRVKILSKYTPKRTKLPHFLVRSLVTWTHNPNVVN